MDYVCVKFGDVMFAASVFEIIVWKNGQTDNVINAAEHPTHATDVGVSRLYQLRFAERLYVRSFRGNKHHKTISVTPTMYV